MFIHVLLAHMPLLQLVSDEDIGIATQSQVSLKAGMLKGGSVLVQQPLLTHMILDVSTCVT